MNDTQIKEYVRKLKEFYTQCFIHLIGNACAILIWGLFAGGGYWPLWVHLTSIAILIIEGYRANIIKCRCDCDWIPFLRQNWEDETFKRIKASQAQEKGQTQESKQTPKETQKVDITKVSVDKKAAGVTAKSTKSTKNIKDKKDTKNTKKS